MRRSRASGVVGLLGYCNFCCPERGQWLQSVGLVLTHLKRILLILNRKMITWPSRWYTKHHSLFMRVEAPHPCRAGLGQTIHNCIVMVFIDSPRGHIWGYMASPRRQRGKGGGAVAERPTRSWPTRAQGGPQEPGPRRPRRAHKGPTHTGPRGPTNFDVIISKHHQVMITGACVENAQLAITKHHPHESSNLRCPKFALREISQHHQ